MNVKFCNSLYMHCMSCFNFLLSFQNCSIFFLSCSLKIFFFACKIRAFFFSHNNFQRGDAKYQKMILYDFSFLWTLKANGSVTKKKKILEKKWKNIKLIRGKYFIDLKKND